MAANSSSRGVVTLGKKLVTQISKATTQSSTRSFSVTSPVLRRSVHTSVYDKNIDDHVRPTVVPDEIIQCESEKIYWGPNPNTGVFGPAAEKALKAGERGFHTLSADGGSESVLEQKAFFRSLEDLDKPVHP